MTQVTGIRDENADEYHADELASVAALSSSIAHVLLTQTPRHAWTLHPRLNPDWERTSDEKFDVGTAAHALILEGTNKAMQLDFSDWRTQTARQARDEARAAGYIPLLKDQYERVLELVDAVTRQLDAHNAAPPLLHDGAAEQAIRWTEPNGVECKARLDWLRTDLVTIDDLKTTSRSANPQAYARRLYDHGGDVQAAFYTRGVQTLYPDALPPPRFRWIVVETNPPYALSVIEPGPDVLAVAHDKVETALLIWARCLEADEWPGYPLEVVQAELPPWEESNWLARRETL